MKKFAALIIFIAVFPIAIALYVWAQFPSDEDIRGCLITKMYHVDLCPKNASYVRLNNISPYMVKTVVLTEDSLFWEHKGFDWDSIKKNYEENAKAGFYKRGGSTITQQLAKNMFLTPNKSMARKALEALITVRIERVLKKKEILERYLNVIEFGNNIYGIKAAANHYFKKSPRDLDIVESAFLAMLLPNPKKYSQSYYKKELTPFASKRIKQIVDNMYQYKRINDDEYNSALVKLETFFRPAHVAMPIDETTDEFSSPDENVTLESLEQSEAEGEEAN